MPCSMAGLGSIRPRHFFQYHHRLAAHEPASSACPGPADAGAEFLDSPAGEAADGCRVIDPAIATCGDPKESPFPFGAEVAWAVEARRTCPDTPSVALHDAARARPWAELQTFKQ